MMFPALKELQTYNARLKKGEFLAPFKSHPIIENKKVFSSDLRSIKNEFHLEGLLVELSERAQIKTPDIIVTNDKSLSQATAASASIPTDKGEVDVIFLDENYAMQSNERDLKNILAHEISHIVLGHTKYEKPPEQVVTAYDEATKKIGYLGLGVTVATGLGTFLLKKSLSIFYRAGIGFAMGALASYAMVKWYSAKADFNFWNKRAEFDADEMGARLTGDKQGALDLLKRSNEGRFETQTLQERIDHLNAIPF